MPNIIPTPLPFIFVNGTVADATQVNSDLNTIVNNVNAFYSTGTWTPTLVGTPGNPGSVTYTTQAGSYEQIGRLIHVRFQVAWSAFSAGAGNQVGIGGLPFTIGADSVPGNAWFSDWGSAITSGPGQKTLGGQISASFPGAIGLVLNNSNTAISSFVYGVLASASQIIGSAIYHT